MPILPDQRPRPPAIAILERMNDDSLGADALESSDALAVQLHGVYYAAVARRVQEHYRSTGDLDPKIVAELIVCGGWESVAEHVRATLVHADLPWCAGDDVVDSAGRVLGKFVGIDRFSYGEGEPQLVLALPGRGPVVEPLDRALRNAAAAVRVASGGA